MEIKALCDSKAFGIYQAPAADTGVGSLAAVGGMVEVIKELAPQWLSLLRRASSETRDTRGDRRSEPEPDIEAG